MKWKKYLTGKNNGDETMKKQRKICATKTCGNDAPKTSDYCGNHRAKSNGGLTYVPKSECHKGNVLVFTTPEGISVFGGGSSRGGGWWRMDPLPDVAIGPKDIIGKGVGTSGKHSLPAGWKSTETTVEDAPALIGIDWPDYSIPRGLGREFWLALVEDIYTRGVKTISCQCMGGHGRTGVQLAILAHYLLPESQHTWKDAGELVLWVRKHMCYHEVEAVSQQKYIAEVCGLDMGVTQVEEKSWGGYSYAGYNTKSVYQHLNDDLDDDLDDQGWTWSKSVGWTKSTPSSDGDDSERVFECLNCDAQEVIGQSVERNEAGEIHCITCEGSMMVDVTDVSVDKIGHSLLKEQNKKQESE
tara:strand:- start:7909 stop:8976 length:1068 start_codon:yes stop_codon:yes gene_type:complete